MMQTQQIQVECANINLPLNQSVQQGNGAQFALMLSLLMEGLPAQSTEKIQSQPLQTPVQASSDFNLESAQGRALQSNQTYHFNLLRSLYEERAPMGQASSMNQADLNAAGTVLDEISYGYQPGSTSLGSEAAKIGLAPAAQAA